MELFNYYGDFVQLPLFLAADFYYLTEHTKIDTSIFIVFFLGFLMYGALLEYGFHRYLYHGYFKKIKQLHLIHHKYPQSYVSSPPYVTAILLLLFHVIFITLLGYKLGCALVAGITFGYLWYIIIHHIIHHPPTRNFKLINYFIEEHQLHHDHAKLNYCVSQPFWNNLYRILGQAYC